MRNQSLQTAQIPPHHYPTTDTVTDTVKALLEVMRDRIMSRSEIMQELGLKHKTHFLESYLNPAIQLGLIEPTKKPNHPRQKYRQKKSKI